MTLAELTAFDKKLRKFLRNMTELELNTPPLAKGTRRQVGRLLALYGLQYDLVGSKFLFPVLLPTDISPHELSLTKSRPSSRQPTGDDDLEGTGQHRQPIARLCTSTGYPLAGGRRR